MKPPSSRYRIEEHGRTLVTIDTWAETKPSGVTSRPLSPVETRPVRPKFGHLRFKSALWYDLYAPRVIDIPLWSVVFGLLFNRLFWLAAIVLVVLAVLLVQFWLPMLAIALIIPASRSWLKHALLRFTTWLIDRLATYH